MVSFDSPGTTASGAGASPRIACSTAWYIVSASPGSRSSGGTASSVSTAPVAGRVDHLDGPAFGDPQAPGRRDTPDAGAQDRQPGGRGAAGRPPRVDQQAEQRRVGEAEGDVRVPPGAQVGHGIERLVDGLPGDVGAEDVLGDDVEQGVLVREEPVDGRMAAGRPPARRRGS